jgi:hypothetical protein
MCAPKGIGPRKPRIFPCKVATSEGAEVGPLGADHGPRSSGVRVSAELEAEVMPPLWQYLLPL